MRHWPWATAALAVVACTLAGCDQQPEPADAGGSPSATPSEALPRPSRVPAAGRTPWPFRDPLPGMPPAIDHDVYARTHAGMVRPLAADDPARLYVPDSTGSTVTVIDQRSRKVVRVVPAGHLSQHVVPSYDLRRLIVTSSVANRLVKIDPRTGRRTGSVAVPRPYNLYFTPDGGAAIVMEEEHDRIRFADPTTFETTRVLNPRGCHGPNHADFSADGRTLVVTCEFSGELVRIDTRHQRVLGVLRLRPHPTARRAPPGMGMSMPQDIRLAPDGRTFYVADMGTNEVRVISASRFRQVDVIGVPRQPHGIYPSRDGQLFYVSARGAGKVSVVDPDLRRTVDTWTIPGGGSPDMGGVSADGSMLWLSGRYDGVVYGFATRTGRLVARIPVGGSPHGLAVWPQPGRYSLGHTGNLR